MIQQLINERLRKEQEERNNKGKSDKFYPSLLGRCFRCQIFNRAHIQPSNPPDERALRIFKCGKLFHDFVQNFLPEHQIEVPCENDEFKGRADVVANDTVYDIKSVHSQSFWYSNKEDYDVKVEKFHQWLQVTYYAWVLKKEKICLVQISKDDLCLNEYWDFTKNWLESLQIEIDQLRFYWANYLKDKENPSADPRFTKECKYCSYMNLCKEIEKDGDREHPYDKLLADSKSKRRSRKSTPEVASR